MFWVIIFDFTYTDILIKKLADSAPHTNYACIFFVRSFIKLVKKIQKIEKLFNIIYQSYKVQYNLSNLWEFVNQWAFLFAFVLSLTRYQDSNINWLKRQNYYILYHYRSVHKLISRCKKQKMRKQMTSFPTTITVAVLQSGSQKS